MVELIVVVSPLTSRSPLTTTLPEPSYVAPVVSRYIVPAWATIIL